MANIMQNAFSGFRYLCNFKNHGYTIYIIDHIFDRGGCIQLSMAEANQHLTFTYLENSRFYFVLAGHVNHCFIISFDITWSK